MSSQRSPLSCSWGTLVAVPLILFLVLVILCVLAAPEVLGA
jgi:hypothetical protein